MQLIYGAKSLSIIKFVSVKSIIFFMLFSLSKGFLLSYPNTRQRTAVKFCHLFMKFTACWMPFNVQPLQITKYYYWLLKGGHEFYPARSIFFTQNFLSILGGGNYSFKEALDNGNPTKL